MPVRDGQPHVVRGTAGVGRGIQQPVVVGEVHIAIDDERSQIGVVLNRVAVDDPSMAARKHGERRDVHDGEHDADGGEHPAGMALERLQRQKANERVHHA